MDIEVTKTNNIPQNSVISIRAGNTRRQAALSALDRPLKFPNKPDSCTTFKVDVLDMLGTARLAYHPGEKQYLLELDPVNNGSGKEGSPGMEVAFTVHSADDEKVNDVDANNPAKESNAWRHRQELAAKDYLEAHGLLSFMQFLMQSLMKDKPAYPYTFLQKQCAIRMTLLEDAKSSLTAEAPKPSEVLAAQGNLETPDKKDEEPLDAPVKKDKEQLDAPVKKEEPELKPNSPDVDLQEQTLTLEQLTKMEHDANAARIKLVNDNLQMRRTASELKLVFKKLVEESMQLHRRAAEVVDSPKHKETNPEKAVPGSQEMEAPGPPPKPANRDSDVKLAEESAQEVGKAVPGSQEMDAPGPPPKPANRDPEVKVAEESEQEVGKASKMLPGADQAEAPGPPPKLANRAPRVPPEEEPQQEVQKATHASTGASQAQPPRSQAYPKPPGTPLLFKDILKMQDEISSLSRENEQLAQELAQMQNMIGTVRDEIEEMNQLIAQGA